MNEEAGQKLIDYYVTMRKIGAGRGQVSFLDIDFNISF